MFDFLSTLHFFVETQLGRLGITQCTEVRARAGRRTTLISFEMRHRDRPLRLAARRSVSHSFAEFDIVDWFSLTDDTFVASVIVEHPTPLEVF